MKHLFFLVILLATVSCQNQNQSEDQKIKWLDQNPPIPPAEPYAMDSRPTLIKNARIMTANGVTIDRGFLYLADGLIKDISEQEIEVPEGTMVIDGTDLTVTPGIIDVHSHMGVYPSPSVDAHEDGNEMTRPVTPDVWAEHGFWPQDPDLWRALAGGVTTIQVLPGSGNLIGGRTFTAKLIPKISAREMRFDGAPQGLKMACGENPKRVYKNKSIMTRMGNVANYRKVFQEALEYLREWESYSKNKKGKIPKRNLVSETLAKVIKGEIVVHFHCYRADDISAILDVADEFGFKIRTIHHGLEAYKLAPRLAKSEVATATWADWWGFKAEAFDGIPYNAAILEHAGAKAIIHSDSSAEVRYLNLEAGKALSSAKELGLDFSEDQALAWVTKNAAWALGLQDKIGTIEKGKMADVVLWDGHPFSITTKTKMVFINGKKVFDRANKERPLSDFEVGYMDMAFNDGRNFEKVSNKKTISWADKENKLKKEISSSFLISSVKAFIDGQWVDDATVVVEDGKITHIGSDFEAPSEFPQIDGKGKYLTPGLIQSFSSLGLFEISLDSRAQDLMSGGGNQPTPAHLASDSLNRRSIRIPISRKQGITTAIASNAGSIAGGQAVAFDLLPDSDFIKKHVALVGSLRKKWGDNNRTDIWSKLRVFLNDVAFYLNNKKDYNKGSLRDLMVSHSHLEAMKPFISGQQPWIMEVNRAEDIKNLIALKQSMKTEGLDINFVIRGGAEAWLLADQLKQHDIPVLLSPTEQTPSTFNKTKARFDLAAFLHSKGVQIIINDEGDLGAPRLRQEAGMAVKYGLSPETALSAITATPAEIFNLKDRGSIKVGQRANLALWSADPLEPTSLAEKVWIEGKDTDLRTRQLKLAEKYLPTLKAQK